MQGPKAGAPSQVVGDKGGTKSRGDARRAEVTAMLQGILAATEADAPMGIDGMNPGVEAAVETGQARSAGVRELGAIPAVVGPTWVGRDARDVLFRVAGAWATPSRI